MTICRLIILLLICSSVFTFNSPNTHLEQNKVSPFDAQELGENCIKNINCSIQNSECTNEQCRCKQYYFEQNKQCLRGVGAECLEQNCQANNSICGSKGHCVCQPRFIFSSTDRCVPIRSYGEPCEENEQCSCLSDKKCKLDETYKDIVCLAKQCMCQPDHHYAFRRTACVYNSSIGEQCGTDDNCELILFAECYKNKCVCKANYFASEGKCKQGLDSFCLNDSKCSAVPNAECVKNECKCKEKFVKKSTELCVPVTSFGEQCEYAEQCAAHTENATCEAITDGAGKICRCRTGQHHHATGCYETKKLDEHCDSYSECFVTSKFDSVKCQGNKCVCAEGFTKINETYCDGAGSIMASVMLVVFMVMFKSAV